MPWPSHLEVVVELMVELRPVEGELVRVHHEDLPCTERVVCRGGAEAVQRRRRGGAEGCGGVRRGAELQLGVIVAAAEAAAARLRCPCPPPGQGGWSVVSGQGQGQGQWSGVAGGSKPLRVSNGGSGAWLPPASSASPRPLPRTWSSTATWSRQAARAPNGTRRRGPAKVGLGFRIGGMGLGVVAVGV